MAKFTAKLVEFTPSFIMKAKSGKNMEMWKLDYEVAGKAKFFQGFASQLKTDKVLAKQLSQFSPGDYIEIETEQNAAGYDNIKAVTQAGAGAKADVAPSSSSGKSVAASRDFETKEERTARQRLIVRQSSLAQAVVLAPKAKTDQILALAEQFCDWVFEEDTSTVGAGMIPEVAHDDLIDDDLPM